MKRVLVISFSLIMFFAKAQNIEGSYVEMVHVSALGKTAFALYYNGKMEALQNDKGEKVTGEDITIGLNVLAERGFEVVAVYESNKGNSRVRTYLLYRKKEKK